MGFIQHTLLIYSHIIPSQLASEDPEHYCLAWPTLGLLQGPLKRTLTRLYSFGGFISHSGSALECVLDCVLKRGISSGLLPFDVISSPLLASIKFLSTFTFSSGVDMLQRRSSPASCGWSWKGLCEWTAAQ